MYVDNVQHVFSETGRPRPHRKPLEAVGSRDQTSAEPLPAAHQRSPSPSVATEAAPARRPSAARAALALERNVHSPLSAKFIILLQNSLFLIQNSLFLTQSSLFLIQNSSFLLTRGSSERFGARLCHTRQSKMHTSNCKIIGHFSIQNHHLFRGNSPFFLHFQSKNSQKSWHLDCN